jgi:hypothetical protein
VVVDLTPANNTFHVSFEVLEHSSATEAVLLSVPKRIALHEDTQLQQVYPEVK